MIPEHLARYANQYPRAQAIDLLNDVRKYASSKGMENWTVEQYADEMRRVYNAVNAAIELLGGERLPRR